MTRQFVVNAKPSNWGDSNGHQTPVVRLYGGAGGRSVVVGYDAIPALIDRLELLLQEHESITELVDRLID